MKRRPAPKRRNPAAKALAAPQHRQRKVPKKRVRTASQDRFVKRLDAQLGVWFL